MVNDSYYVFGIGNALVDIEYLVDDETLRNQNIEKGMMTLVGPEVGEGLDKIGLKASKVESGGSAGNSMACFAQLGGSGFFSCRVAGDSYGNDYEAGLRKIGLKTNITDSRPEGVTGNCRVLLTEDAERTMLTFLGVTSDFSVNDIDFDALAKSSLLYVEGYLVASPNAKTAAKKAIEFARENGVKTALTLSDPSMPTFFKNEVLELLDSKVDYLFCNEEEGEKLTGLSDQGEVLKNLLNYADNIIMTLGKDGALFYNSNALVKESGLNVNAIDTLGAGDSFAGGFLYGLEQNLSSRDSLKLAISLSGTLVTKRGPRLSQDEIEEIKKALKLS